MNLLSLSLSCYITVSVNVQSESADEPTADFERRVRSGPKERTQSATDSVHIGPSLSVSGRLVLTLILS